jgi:hypothetical protein
MNPSPTLTADFGYWILLVVGLTSWLFVYWSWNPDRIPRVQREQPLLMALIGTGWALPATLAIDSLWLCLTASIIDEQLGSGLSHTLVVVTRVVWLGSMVVWLLVLFAGWPRFVIAPAFRGDPYLRILIRRLKERRGHG